MANLTDFIHDEIMNGLFLSDGEEYLLHVAENGSEFGVEHTCAGWPCDAPHNALHVKVLESGLADGNPDVAIEATWTRDRISVSGSRARWSQVAPRGKGWRMLATKGHSTRWVRVRRWSIRHWDK